MNRHNFEEFLARYNEDVPNTDLFLVLSYLPVLGKEGPWIAGGAVRKTLQNKPLDSDFDFFFKDEGQMDKFCEELTLLGFELTASNDHNRTYAGTIDKKPTLIQAITITYYASLEDALDSFDFTITQFGFDGQDLVCGEFSLFDLQRNKLALHKLTYGVSTVRRLIKYTKQGFTACQGTFVDILSKIAENPALIHEDIKYID